MPVVRTETFAPILYLIAYDTLDEAVALQNSVPYGLSSAVFTDRLQVAERFLSAEGSDCGIANVNLGTSGAEIGGAFGGEKDTGGGREAGLGFLEGLHAPPDQYHQLEFAAAAGAGHQVQRVIHASISAARCSRRAAEIGPRVLSSWAYSDTRYSSIQCLQLVELRNPAQLGAHLLLETRVARRPAAKSRTICGGSPPRAALRCQRRCSAFR